MTEIKKAIEKDYELAKATKLRTDKDIERNIERLYVYHRVVEYMRENEADFEQLFIDAGKDKETGVGFLDAFYWWLVNEWVFRDVCELNVSTHMNYCLNEFLNYKKEELK